MKRSADSTILRHWRQKLISLGIAVALFLYVGNMRISERVIAVPLQIRNSPGFLVPVISFPETVTLRIKGKPRQLMVFDPQDVTAAIDLSSARPGYNTFFLDLHYNRQPEHFTIVPAVKSFRVFMDRVMIKRLSLKAVLINRPAVGFVIDSFRLNPENVQVRGPISVLREINQLSCRPVNISGINQSTERIVAPDFKGNNLTLQTPVSITLSINVVPLRVTREFRDVPLAVRGTAPGLKIRGDLPGKIVVTIHGGRTSVLALRTNELKPVLDLSAINKPGSYTVPVSLSVPPGIAGVSTSPSNVLLVVE